MLKGQIISGDYGKILIRQKSDTSIELGELLIGNSSSGKILMWVYDLYFGSQISQQNLELISGMRLEEDEDVNFMEPELRNYTVAIAKSVLSINGPNSSVCKQLPQFFSDVRQVTKEDLSFLKKPEFPLFMGDLRSGSTVLDLPVFLKGKDVLSHHILVAATTGRGKSNLTSCILWNLIEHSYAGILVLDPHDEYYGRSKQGLKDHPSAKDNVSYFTPLSPPPGAQSLKINLKSLRPGHFSFVNFSDPQRQALNSYYRKYRTDWVYSIVAERPLDVEFNDSTLNVLRRRLMSILDLDFRNANLYSEGIFDVQAGESTISDICNNLEDAKIVIVDTSHFSNDLELLIANMIASDIFKKYKNYKMKGVLSEKPVVSIILEEAPRVLGKDVLEKGPNVFSSIAREGRKFKVGLFAITQLPSSIPRDILANMNTKIILGIEMNAERQAIIDSAAQDLSKDARSIASLDKGEAIITSNFARFATPVKIPLFADVIIKTQNSSSKYNYKGSSSFPDMNNLPKPKQVFSGIKLGN